VVCPANIDTVNLWEDIRRLIVKADYGPLESQKALIKSVKSYDNPWQQPRAGREKWARRAKKENLIRDLPREIKKTKGKVLSAPSIFWRHWVWTTAASGRTKNAVGASC
jgi:heterodisulfide reductase subunit D